MDQIGGIFVVFGIGTLISLLCIGIFQIIWCQKVKLLLMFLVWNCMTSGKKQPQKGHEISVKERSLIT